jgi:outer membrane protein OmpA-like peptidoglycan-associated protein
VNKQATLSSVAAMRLLFLCCTISSVGFADSVEISMMPKAQFGKTIPNISISIQEPIAGFWIKLKSNAGDVIDRKGGGKPGVTRTIDLVSKEGPLHWTGTLDVNLPNGTTSSMPLEFDTETVTPIRIKIDKNKDFDLAQRALFFVATQKTKKVHLKVLMDTATTSIDDDIEFNNEPAGTRLSVTWREKKGNVMTVNIRVFDESGFYDSIELSPWRIDIKHVDVNFESGKADIKESEVAKLEKPLAEMIEAAQKYGRLAPIRLFVGGHTDTVGASAGNRALSINRAKSLAAFFRKKGLSIPVMYEGFGEDSLAVRTPDETAEEKNRRADYVISIDEPTMGAQANWKKL